MIDYELYEIQRFVHQINQQNSKLYKQSVLKQYADNILIKDFLYFMYNPYIATGISDKKIEYNPLSWSKIAFNHIQDLMEYLKTNNTGSHEVLNNVIGLMYNVSAENRDILKAIVTKNIQLGIDATTINKVIPNLIPQFKIQLAEKYFEHPDYVNGKEMTITTKIDGGRIIAIKEKGNVSFYTRAGQPYEGLVDLEKEFIKMPFDNIVLDGEIMLFDRQNLTSKEQYKETMKITRADGEKHGIKMLVFDILPVEDFNAQKSIIPYRKRREMLDECIKNVSPYFEVLPSLYTGTDTSKIKELLDKQTSQGEEGVMINFSNASYEFKRSLSLLKVKKMQDIDLPIIGFEEGKNKNKGTLGAVLVNYKDNIVKVGSGFSDELRQEIWNNQNKYIGVTIAVQYFEETSNSKGGIGLRFPVFLDFRFDKPM